MTSIAVTEANGCMIGNGTTCIPVRTTPEGINPADVFYIVSTIVVGFGMIGIGATVHYKTLFHYLRHPKAFILGVALQLLVLPPLSWAFIKIFDMDFGESLGVFIQGASPGGNTSNLVVFWMGGIVDLSVAMTVTTTLISMGTIPLWLFIYQKAELGNETFPIPFDRIAIALAVLVIPVFIGILIRVKLEKQAKIISRVLIIFASLSILILIVARAIIAQVPWIPTWKQITVAAIMPPVAFVIGYLVTLIPQLGLDSRSKKTVAVETALQNAQIAGAVIELINSRLRNPLLAVRMLLFPLLYYVFQVGYSIIFIAVYNVAKRKGWVKESDNDDVGIDVGKSEEIEANVLKTKVNDKVPVSNPDLDKGKDNPTFNSV